MDPRIALKHRARVEQFQRKHRSVLVTMLFSDIVGSTKLKQALGDRLAIDVIQRHHAIVRENLTRFEEAQEIDTAGDSFFIVFTKPSDAVRFSLLNQARLHELAADTGYPVFDRIGIHVGEVWVSKSDGSPGKSKDLYGIQVDTCARISSLANADQILLSRFAFDSARQVLRGEDLEHLSRLSWLNHGLYSMKGVDDPVEVCEVGEIGRAKLAPPADAEKAHRLVSDDSAPVLGWRPAINQAIPGTSWVLDEKLGEGGFGEVWSGCDKVLKTRHVFKFCFRADRVRSLKREVTLFRLLNERIGAHPNIVAVEKVYFEEPPFYIVMQYVEGKDLATWCEAQGGIEKVPLKVRLEIVARVADALQAAHDSGIIHRDVKPSNILVSGLALKDLDVHLTDFGIGQVVSREILAGMTQQLGFTETMMGKDSRSGTYMYMAPELVRGEPASAASDIYSLAVALFQLLAGDLQRPLTADWEKAIAERLLREDLSHGLATNPAERFASAKDLAGHLRSLPIRRAVVEQRTAEARARENIAQRQSKRTRILQFAGAAAACIFGTWILVSWQLRAEMAELHKGIMEYPQIEAQVHGSRAENNPAVLQEQIYAHLSKELKLDPKILREKLLQAAEKWREEPNASSYQRANANYVARDYPEAERLALQAADEAKKRTPSSPKNIVQALELAGLSAHRAIQYGRAMQHLRAAEKFTGRNRNLEEWTRVQQDIGDLLVAEGKYGDAEKLFRSIIEVRTRFLGLEHPDTLDSRHRLIYPLTRQTKFAEAEAEAREVLELREKILGAKDVDTLVSRYNLADTLVDQGKNTEAEALYRGVIRLAENLLGPEHPRTLAARSGLAIVLSNEGKNAEAEPLYREVIALDKKVYGFDHPNTLNDRQNLATALQADGKYQAAEAEYRDVIKLEAKVNEAEHPDMLSLRNNLADVLNEEGKFADAEAECRQIISLEQKVLGPEDRVTLNSRGNLAIALIGQRKFPEAEVQYKDVINLMERVLGLENPDTWEYTIRFTTALSHQNRNDEAIEIAKGIADHAHEFLGPDNPSTQKYAKLVQDLRHGSDPVPAENCASGGFPEK